MHTNREFFRAGLYTVREEEYGRLLHLKEENL
jgi:hypothetical protein